MQLTHKDQHRSAHLFKCNSELTVEGVFRKSVILDLKPITNNTSLKKSRNVNNCCFSCWHHEAWQAMLFRANHKHKMILCMIMKIAKIVLAVFAHVVFFNNLPWSLRQFRTVRGFGTGTDCIWIQQRQFQFLFSKGGKEGCSTQRNFCSISTRIHDNRF